MLSLAAATLLIAYGLFASWQLWLVVREQGAEAKGRAARTGAITAVAGEVRSVSARIERAVADPSIATALGGGDAASRAAAAEALHAILPGIVHATFFAPEVDEVIKGDLSRLGYARAAMLMQAQSSGEPAPAQILFENGKPGLIGVVMPVRIDDRIAAFALVEQSSASLLAAFDRTALSGVRLDLRQGEGHGDLVIASVGDGGGISIADVGEPVPGSRLRVGIAPPNYFIVLPRLPWLLGAIALLCVGAGFGALWLRKVGWRHALESVRRGAPVVDETPFAEALEREVEHESTRKDAGTGASIREPVPPKAAATKPARPRPPDKPVEVSPEIFRAYDIRGVVGKTLSADVARMIGKAIGSEAREREQIEIVVGRDGRDSGPELAGALIDGLRSTGIGVIDIGMAPTPVTYFGAYQLLTNSCVSVTGSHNPPDYNGFKIVLGGETLSDQAIQGLYRRIAEGRLLDADSPGGLQTMDVAADYRRAISEDIPSIARRLKVVVDCGNGVAGALAPDVLAAIGCQVEPLYCDVDGSFPNHHPDPSDLHNLKDLILAVKSTGADVGLAFDGDGDRLGVVTPDGEAIFPDRLLMLFAIDVLETNPGATIIYDVKCTGQLHPLILEHGGSPLMWKTGHSLIKAKMRETEALLAGEMSGHFFFKHRWFGFDDGIYAAARLVERLAGDVDQRSPQEVFADLPKGVATPELKIPTAEGDQHRFVDAFKRVAAFDGARVTTIDGVRADWKDGFGLIRASNTTPILVMRFVADDQAALMRIQDAFRERLRAFDPSLKLPF
jgi:phosphomannomutase/phosphoglucomutase